MSLLRRPRRSLAQSTTEYMLMISVISIGLIIVLEKFSNPNGVVQQAAEQLATDYESSLDNSSGSMRLQ